MRMIFNIKEEGFYVDTRERIQGNSGQNVSFDRPLTEVLTGLAK